MAKKQLKTVNSSRHCGASAGSALGSRPCEPVCRFRQFARQPDGIHCRIKIAAFNLSAKY